MVYIDIYLFLQSTHHAHTPVDAAWHSGIILHVHALGLGSKVRHALIRLLSAGCQVDSHMAVSTRVEDFEIDR